ncbi:MAG: trypsin-like serine protease [bacterium]|nr:trypsin-like serine protease [bacterium]
MLKRVVFVFGLGFVVGCSDGQVLNTEAESITFPGSEGAPVACQISQAVFGGEYDIAYTAVVSMLNATDQCSGTLIAADRVLTAAHCVCAPTNRTTSPWIVHAEDCGGTRTSVDVYRAQNVDGGIEGIIDSFDGTVVVHPGLVMTEDWPGADHFHDYEHDIAVIQLDSRVDAKVVPIVIAKTSPTPCIGATVVGFGNNEATDGGAQIGYGTRRVGIVGVTKVTCDVLETSPSAEGDVVFNGHGDSGGPLLMSGEDGIKELVGVASYRSGTTGGFMNAVNDRDWILAQ